MSRRPLLLATAAAIIPASASAQITIMDANGYGCPPPSWAPYGGGAYPEAFAYWFPSYLFLVGVMWLVAILALWPWLGERRLPIESRRVTGRLRRFVLISAAIGPLAVYLSAGSEFFSRVGAAAVEILAAATGARQAFACIGPAFQTPPGHAFFLGLGWALLAFAVITLVRFKRSLAAAPQLSPSASEPSIRQSLHWVRVASLALLILQGIAILLNAILYRSR